MKRKITEKEQVFWCRYADALMRRGITGKSAEWMIHHAQGFAYDGLGGVRLKALATEELEIYWGVIGRKEFESLTFGMQRQWAHRTGNVYKGQLRDGESYPESIFLRGSEIPVVPALCIRVFYHGVTEAQSNRNLRVSVTSSEAGGKKMVF